MAVDTKDLEKALEDLAKDTSKTPEVATEEISEADAKAKAQAEPNISKEEEIGFHKGAINTLLSERNELVKMVGNVEAIMQMHLQRLQELGVKIEVKEPVAQAPKAKK